MYHLFIDPQPVQSENPDLADLFDSRMCVQLSQVHEQDNGSVFTDN